MHRHTHTVCFLLQKKRILHAWEFLWGSSGDSRPLPVCPCFSQPGQTKKDVHRSHSDMIDCSDLPLWVLLSFGFFVCLDFVLWFWFFSHSLLFLL